VLCWHSCGHVHDVLWYIGSLVRLTANDWLASLLDSGLGSHSFCNIRLSIACLSPISYERVRKRQPLDVISNSLSNSRKGKYDRLAVLGLRDFPWWLLTGMYYHNNCTWHTIKMMDRILFSKFEKCLCISTYKNWVVMAVASDAKANV